MALVLALQLVFAVRYQRPVLLVSTLVYIVFFVYSAGPKLTWHIREWSRHFEVSEYYVTVATWMALLVVIASIYGYSFPRKNKPKRRQHLVVVYSDLLLICLSVVGLATMVVIFYLQGGVVSVWKRSPDPVIVPWAGLVSGLNELALIYPMFTFYHSSTAGMLRTAISILILFFYGIFAALSGVSTAHVMRLTPFLLIWLARRRLTWRRALFAAVAGFIVVSFFRFSRTLGATLALGGDLNAAIEAYQDPDNSVNTANSFGELVTFSQVVQIAGNRTDWRYGESYLATATDLVPGILLPNKSQILATMPAALFLPRYYGIVGVSWTAGFYGEAYENFGLPGLIVVSFLFGCLLGKAEALLSSDRSFFWIPHWYIGCTLAATLVLMVRNDSDSLMAFVAPLGLCVILGELMSLLLPYGPARVSRRNIGFVSG